MAALRATESGRSVVVAEMGRRISAADMEEGARSARRLLWEPALGLHGYFRQTVLRDVTVVGGVGVGGGSLVYAAVLLRPDAETLAAHFDHPNYHNMRDMLGKFGLKSAVSRKHRIDASAPVYGPDFKASANFD